MSAIHVGVRACGQRMLARQGHLLVDIDQRLSGREVDKVHRRPAVPAVVERERDEHGVSSEAAMPRALHCDARREQRARLAMFEVCVWRGYGGREILYLIPSRRNLGRNTRVQCTMERNFVVRGWEDFWVV